MANPIKVLLSSENSLINEVLFRWQGMIIYLGQTSALDGRIYLSVNVANALDAVNISEKETATFIISREDTVYKDAIARTTLPGPAQPVIEKNT